jgi:c-di-AMP phosphodiesterase-like protein
MPTQYQGKTTYGRSFRARSAKDERVHRVGQGNKPYTWEAVLDRIRGNLKYAKEIFHKHIDVKNIEINVPIGIIRGNRINKVGWVNEGTEGIYIYPMARIIIRNKMQGRQPRTTQTLELRVGTLIEDRFRRKKKFKYYIDNKKRVVVCYQIISDNHLERQIKDYIKECNNIKFLYCD